jgi:hypothetical protein
MDRRYRVFLLAISSNISSQTAHNIYLHLLFSIVGLRMKDGDFVCETLVLHIFLVVDIFHRRMMFVYHMIRVEMKLGLA